MPHHLLCQHLEENVDEYIGFLKNRNSAEDDVTLIKEYFRALDLLKQSGYWSNSAGDFLPLALANWSHRPLCIYSSRPEQPVIETQPTLCPPTEEDSICLACKHVIWRYFRSLGRVQKVSNRRSRPNTIRHWPGARADAKWPETKKQTDGDGDNENSHSSFAADIISTPNGKMLLNRKYF